MEVKMDWSKKKNAQDDTCKTNTYPPYHLRNTNLSNTRAAACSNSFKRSSCFLSQNQRKSCRLIMSKWLARAQMIGLINQLEQWLPGNLPNAYPSPKLISSPDARIIAVNISVHTYQTPLYDVPGPSAVTPSNKMIEHQAQNSRNIGQWNWTISNTVSNQTKIIMT